MVSAMKTLQCPHCGEGIDVLEPSDMDGLGIKGAKRTELIAKGALKPWAKLRTGRIFLYLKGEVDEYLATRQFDSYRKQIKKRNPTIEVVSFSEEDVEILRQIEEKRREALEAEEAFMRRVEARTESVPKP